MNVFKKPEIANQYDSYYLTKMGKRIDKLEKKAFESIIADIKPCLMLEIGCGTGHWTSFFSEKGFIIKAVDNSEAMLEIAQKKNIKNTEFTLANAECLPFESQSFSLIIAVAALEFVNNLNKVMHEINRILKHDGFLIIGALNPFSKLFANKDKSITFSKANFLTKEEWLNLLSSFGQVTLKETVYLTEQNKILEYSKSLNSAFMIFRVKK